MASSAGLTGTKINRDPYLMGQRATLQTYEAKDTANIPNWLFFKSCTTVEPMKGYRYSPYILLSKHTIEMKDLGFSSVFMRSALSRPRPRGRFHDHAQGRHSRCRVGIDALLLQKSKACFQG